MDINKIQDNIIDKIQARFKESLENGADKLTAEMTKGIAIEATNVCKYMLEQYHEQLLKELKKD